MKLHKLLVASAIVGSMSLAACGGGGGTGAPGAVPTTNPSKPTQQATAKSTLTMRVPLNFSGGKKGPSLRNSGAIRPMFVDGNSNGTVNVYFDGTSVLNFSSNGSPGAGPSGSANLSNGGSFTWTSAISLVGNQPVATITANYATVPGLHTIGAVQLDGACVGPDPCIPNTDGYVLAEGQTTQVLQSGSNGNANLYMRGVMESAYVCDPGCTGQNLSVDGQGYYDLYVVVADENGTAITHQFEDDGTTPVPFDNGSYTIAEQNPQGNNGTGILSIDKPGPFTAPGTDRASGGYGVDIKVKCVHTGTTTLAAVLDATGGTPGVPVAGFTYTANNYPSANMVLGSVGSDIYYGNQLALNCDASGTLTIQ